MSARSDWELGMLELKYRRYSYVCAVDHDRE